MKRTAVRDLLKCFVVGIVLTTVSITTFAVGESPQGITYEGRLYDSGFTGPQLGTADFRIDVLDPTGTCILYSETQTGVNLTASDGVFALSVGSSTGSAKRNNPGPVGPDTDNSMVWVFQNANTINGNQLADDTTDCVYNPVAGDARLLKVTVTVAAPEGTGVPEVLSPNMTINSVPNALVCESVQGYGISDILISQVAGGTAAAVTNSNVQDLFDSTTDASTNSWHHHDSAYIKSSDLKVDGSGNVGIGTTSPVNPLHIDANGVAATTSGIRVDRETSDSLGNFYFGSGSYEATNYRDFAIGINSSILNMTTKSAEFRLNQRSATPMTFHTNDTEAMRIDPTGQIGIGTNSPSYLVDARGTTTTFNGFHYTDTDTASGVVLGEGYGQHGVFGTSLTSLCLSASNCNDSNSSVIQLLKFGVNISAGGYNSGGDIIFKTWPGTAATAPTEQVRIKEITGNVGIGTPSPTSKLHVHDEMDTDQASVFYDINSNHGVDVAVDRIGVKTDYNYSGAGDVDSNFVMQTNYQRTGTGEQTVYDAGLDMTFDVDDGTAGTLYGINIDGPDVAAGKGLAKWVGLYIDAPSGAGTITKSIAFATGVAAGNVGIGYPNPGYILDVRGTTTTNEGITYTDFDTNSTVMMGESYGSFGIFGMSAAMTSLCLSSANCNSINSSLIKLNKTGNFGITLDAGGYNDGGDIIFKTWPGTGTTTSVEQVRIKEITGNVGIGTPSPTSKLHVHDGTGAGGGMEMFSLSSSYDGGTKRLDLGMDPGSAITSSPVGVISGTSDLLILSDSDGNTGVNTSIVLGYGGDSDTGTAVLTVNGNDEVLVSGAVVVGSPTGGSQGAGTINAVGVYDDGTLLTDYVFEKYYDGSPIEERHSDYKMMSFNETIDFTKNNKHLPTIIGRKEWEEEGRVSLGVLTQQIWETVETHFLFMTEEKQRLDSVKAMCEMSEAELASLKTQTQKLDRRISSLESENKELRAKNKELEERLEKLERLIQ